MDVTYKKLTELLDTPEELERTEAYLAECLRAFLRPGEEILICYPDCSEHTIGGLLIRGVRRLGAVPLQWGPDYRWKTLLKLAFHSRATAIAGPPLVILGLTKLARATRTPLNFRNVLTAGYPCLEWMIDGIQTGLDCQTWGCYGPGSGPLVGGFSCGKSRGVHLREDIFSVEVEDDDGAPLPETSLGNLVIIPRKAPSVRYHTRERGRLDRTLCTCGDPTPRLMDLGPGPDVDDLLAELGAELMSWTSILDCRLERGRYGLELELITFPGEKLPRLPSCARLVVRSWDPERDVPNWFQVAWRKPTENS